MADESPNSRSPQAIVFDWDGVLAFAKSYVDRDECLRETLAVSTEVKPSDSISKEVKGTNWQRVLWQAAAIQLPADAKSDFERAMQLSCEFLRKCFTRLEDVYRRQAGNVLAAWAPATMEQMPANCKVFICSGTIQQEVIAEVRMAGIVQLLDGVYGYPIRKVDLLDMLTEQLQCSPEDVCLIDDSAEAVDAARELGFSTVLVKTQHADGDSPADQGAFWAEGFHTDSLDCALRASIMEPRLLQPRQWVREFLGEDGLLREQRSRRMTGSQIWIAQSRRTRESFYCKVLAMNASDAEQLGSMLSKLAHRGVPVPQMLSCQGRHSIELGGQRCVVFERELRGEPLSSPHPDEDTVRQCAAALACLHQGLGEESPDPGTFRRHFHGGLDSIDNEVDSLWHLLVCCRQYPEASGNGRAQMFREWIDQRGKHVFLRLRRVRDEMLAALAGCEWQPVLGDFNYSNILFLDGALSGIVDFEDIHFGPRELDVLSFCMYGVNELHFPDQLELATRAYCEQHPRGLNCAAMGSIARAIANVRLARHICKAAALVHLNSTSWSRYQTALVHLDDLCETLATFELRDTDACEHQFPPEKMLTDSHNSSLDRILDLQMDAALVRKRMLDTYNGLACLSGAFSAVELYVALYLNHLDPRQVAANAETRTRVLAKGTASLAFYSTLSVAGIIDEELLTQYGTKALPHIYHLGVAGADATQYTLGPSLGTAVGIALASKLKRIPYQVFCFMGDGELQEGVDQAAKAAVSLGLSNLIVVVDCNLLQSYYPVDVGDPTMVEDSAGALSRQRAFWQACGWNATEIDGHDLQDIVEAYSSTGQENSPTVILARTIKGKGIPQIENRLGYEHRMSGEQLEAARRMYADRCRDPVAPKGEALKRQTKPKFPELNVPFLESCSRDLRKTFAEWIRLLKQENDGHVYSFDTDCRNVFTSACTSRIVSRSDYGARHVFPGLNERLAFTIAKGMAYEGLYAVIGSRTNNLTDTSEEWNAICIDRLPVLLAGTRPGAIQADWAPSKCSFMDIEIMGPHGCRVYQPSSSRDMVWLLEQLYCDPQANLPAYLRIPDFENQFETSARDTRSSWQNGFYVASGDELHRDFVAIIATGDSLREVISAARNSRNRDRIKIINLFNLTCLNQENLRQKLAGADRIMSVIEARSSAVSEVLFLAMDGRQRAIYEPLGISSAPAVNDKAVFEKRGFYGARDFVLQSRGLDAGSLLARLDSS